MITVSFVLVIRYEADFFAYMRKMKKSIESSKIVVAEKQFEEQSMLCFDILRLNQL
ncbi:MAG: hypothetical protein ACI4GC_02625 [Acutalibacteraceae bacterium]